MPLDDLDRVDFYRWRNRGSNAARLIEGLRAAGFYKDREVASGGERARRGLMRQIARQWASCATRLVNGCLGWWRVWAVLGASARKREFPSCSRNKIQLDRLVNEEFER